jgi:hypothetical protein
MTDEAKRWRMLVMTGGAEKAIKVPSGATE